jgi:hypothetical protein
VNAKRAQIRAGEDVGPAKIFYDADGNVVGADGRHRALAHLQEGTERMPVEIHREVAAKPEAAPLPEGGKPAEPDYKSAAEKAGVEFRGVQEGLPGKHPGLAIFQDPESKTSVAVKLDEWSPEKLQEHIDAARERMAPKESLFHGTNVQAAEHIQKHGFSTPERIGGIAPGAPQEEKQLTFLSPHKAGATWFANQNVRNPAFGGPKVLEVNFDQSHTFAPKNARSIYSAAQELGVKKLPDGQIDFADFRQKMKDAGYDAVAFRDPYAGNRKAVAVFEPEKISLKTAGTK